jgi:hypothetical protein
VGKKVQQGMNRTMDQWGVMVVGSHVTRSFDGHSKLQQGLERLVRIVFTAIRKIEHKGEFKLKESHACHHLHKHQSLAKLCVLCPLPAVALWQEMISATGINEVLRLLPPAEGW